jgi:opacity protein-like surface antigen
VRIIKMLAVFGVAAAIGGASPVAAAEEEPALTDLVQILKNEGVLDEGQYHELTAKAAKREAKESWTDRISLWGDFRGRYGGFFYTKEDSDVRNRSRLRYRFRLNGKAKINPYATVLFRLASGGNDDRSTNRTLGDLADFASDPIRIDRAYVRMTPFKEGRYPDENGTLFAEFGKVPIPYIRKVSKDFMLWDSDISLEGVSFLTDREVVDNVDLYFNTGYYTVKENSKSSDPNLFAAQLGTEASVTENIDVGARVSYFRFGNVDEDMLERGSEGSAVTSSTGNIIDGMTTSDSVSIIESRLYAKFGFIEDWPITVYGSISGNLSAVSSDDLDVGREHLAWGVGTEIGDKKKWLVLGVNYYDLQANAQFSQYVDSDLFDGNTNRKGFAFYGSKQILPNTEITLTTFWSKPSNKDAGYAIGDDGGSSLDKANRVRVIADMKFKF